MGWKAAQKLIQNWKIVRGDSVMIIRGKDRGETGLIKRVIRSQNRVIVEGKNLVKKHIKQGQGHEGGIFSVEAPLHVSNVQVVDPVTGKKSMAMKAAVMAAMSATKPRVLNRLFTTSAFNFSPPQQSSQQPAAPLADPSPNLFVSGLSKRTTTEGLHEAFSKFGEVVHAKVVTDRGSGFSKGFGFVKYSTTEEAAAGIEGMNGAFLDGWVIFAEFAKPRPPSAYQQQNGSSSFGRGRF